MYSKWKGRFSADAKPVLVRQVERRHRAGFGAAGLGTAQSWFWSRHKVGFGAVGLGSAQSRFCSRHKAGFGAVGLRSAQSRFWSRHKACLGAVGSGSAQSRFWSRHRAGLGAAGYKTGFVSRQVLHLLSMLQNWICPKTGQYKTYIYIYIYIYTTKWQNIIRQANRRYDYKALLHARQIITPIMKLYISKIHLAYLQAIIIAFIPNEFRDFVDVTLRLRNSNYSKYVQQLINNFWKENNKSNKWYDFQPNRSCMSIRWRLITTACFFFGISINYSPNADVDIQFATNLLMPSVLPHQ